MFLSLSVKLINSDPADAKPASVVLWGVAIAEVAEFGTYPFAGTGSETVGFVGKRCLPSCGDASGRGEDVVMSSEFVELGAF